MKGDVYSTMNDCGLELKRFVAGVSLQADTIVYKEWNDRHLWASNEY